MNIDVEQAIQELSELVADGRLIIFVGSGISVPSPSNLPTWDGALLAFIAFCERLQPYLLPTERFDDLIEDAKREREKYPDQVASALKKKLEDIDEDGLTPVMPRFRRWMMDLFNGEPNDYHYDIVSTNYPFILTSNYDELLESAADEMGFLGLSMRSYTYNDPDKIAGVMSDRESSIIHVHGRRTDIPIGEIVFTSQDYQSIENEHPGFRLMLQQMLLTHSVLFVGYGASDPHLEHMLMQLSLFLKWSQHPKLPRHYIVLSEERTGPIRQKHKELTRTKIIPEGADHGATMQLLKALRGAAPRNTEVVG